MTTGKREAPLPIRPCGYQVLVRMHKPPAKTKGNIILVDDTREVAEMKMARGLVVATGADAYTGQHADGSPRFPNGPYCGVGDWIEWNRYQERRIHVGDGDDKVEYAFIHDDRVLGVWAKEPTTW